MAKGYIVDDKVDNRRQFNIRIDNDVLEAFEKVREDMYIKGKALSISDYVEGVLKTATKKGEAWLKDNASKGDIKGRREIVEKKRQAAKDKKLQEELIGGLQ